MLKQRRNQKGFTLIEIIAVLVLLGILAAVAVPRFFDMQDQAKERALKGALAEGISTVNMAYAQQMLSHGGNVTLQNIATKATNNAPSSDDFSYTFTPSDDDGIVVTVTPVAGGAVAGVSAITKLWKLP